MLKAICALMTLAAVAAVAFECERTALLLLGGAVLLAKVIS